MTRLLMSTAQRGTLTARAKRDRRISYRIPMESLGVAAVVESTTPGQAPALGLLVNMSAGGCCLVVTADLARRFTRGDHCTIHLPVTEKGLSYPATLIALDECGETGQDVRLRLRFRKTDAARQQLLTRWINELALHAWHS